MAITYNHLTFDTFLPPVRFGMTDALEVFKLAIERGYESSNIEYKGTTYRVMLTSSSRGEAYVFGTIRVGHEPALVRAHFVRK